MAKEQLSGHAVVDSIWLPTSLGSKPDVQFLRGELMRFDEALNPLRLADSEDDWSIPPIDLAKIRVWQDAMTKISLDIIFTALKHNPSVDPDVEADWTSLVHRTFRHFSRLEPDQLKTLLGDDRYSYWISTINLLNFGLAVEPFEPANLASATIMATIEA